MVRMTKKFGPARITASKRGLGFSVGGGPLRVTKRADGRVQRTVRIPGTGIHDTRVVGSRSSVRSYPRPELPPRGSYAPQPAPFYSVPIRTAQPHRADYTSPGGEVLLVVLGVLCLAAGVVLALHGAVVIALLLIVVGGFPIYFAKVVRVQRRL